MKTRRTQQGWYTGWMPVMLVVVITLLVAQPWMPLMLLAALAMVVLVKGAGKLLHYLRDEWQHSHAPRPDH